MYWSTMFRLGVGMLWSKKDRICLLRKRDGPLRDLPASMSGVMSITGGPENAPYRVGFKSGLVEDAGRAGLFQAQWAG